MQTASAIKLPRSDVNSSVVQPFIDEYIFLEKSVKSVNPDTNGGDQIIENRVIESNRQVGLVAVQKMI